MSRICSIILAVVVGTVMTGYSGPAHSAPEQVNCYSPQAKRAAKYLFEQRTPSFLPGHKERPKRMVLANPWRIKNIAYKGLDVDSVALHRGEGPLPGAHVSGFEASEGRRHEFLAMDINYDKLQKQFFGKESWRDITWGGGTLRYRVPWLNGIFDTQFRFPTYGDWTPADREYTTDNRRLLLGSHYKTDGKNPIRDDLLLTYYFENVNSPALNNSYRYVAHNRPHHVKSREWHGSRALIVTFDQVQVPKNRILQHVNFAWSKSGWAEMSVSACMYAIETKSRHTVAGSIDSRTRRRVKSIETVLIPGPYRSTSTLGRFSSKSGIKTVFDVYDIGDQNFRNTTHDPGSIRAENKFLFTVVTLQSQSSMPVSTTLNFYLEYARD